MLLTLSLLLLAQTAAQAPAETRKSPRDPRTQALTTSDALWSIGEVSGRIIPVGDLDGDGRGDLFVERGGTSGKSLSIDAISSRDGHTIRTVYTFDAVDRSEFAWDAGGDVNGDGVPDLVLGFPNDSSVAKSAGLVRVISGKDGTRLAELHGTAAYDRFGCSLAFIGDLDADHADDFAVGAPQFDPSAKWIELGVAADNLGGKAKDAFEDKFLRADGHKVSNREVWQFDLLSRSTSSGYVSLRSGRTSAEIRRLAGDLPGHGFGSRIDAFRELGSTRPADLLVQCDIFSAEPIRVYRSGSFEQATLVAHVFGWARLAGDLDGDTLSDVAVEPRAADDFDIRILSARFWLSKPSGAAFDVPYPDPFSDRATTFALGDIGVGDAHYNFPYDHPDATRARDQLQTMTLEQALAVKSDGGSNGPNSGCALIVSGRTHKEIFGVWGEPGTRNGLGLAVARLADITGDGFPDLVVNDGSNAYAFAGPGKAAK